MNVPVGGGLAPQGPGRRELALAMAGLGAFALATFGPYVARGGLYWDDWENAATTQHPPPGFVGPVELRLAAYRPILALLLPLPHALVGPRPAAQLAIAAGLVLLMVVCLYALLRTVDVGRWHSGGVATLALLFPYSTATRLWPTGAINNVAVALALLGLAAGIRALDQPAPRARRLRVAAVVLSVLGVLTYEVVAVPALAGFLALYVHRLGWRAGLRRWRTEAVAIALAALLNAVATTKVVQPPGTSLRHAFTLGEQGLVLLARSLVPLGRPLAAAVLAAFALGCAAAAVVGRRLDADNPRRDLLDTGWRLGAAGVAVVALGYAMFVPSPPAYAPLNPGTGDRVNLIAALGFALAAYGGALVVGGLAARLLPQAWRRAPALLTGVVLVAIAAGYAVQGRRHQRQWERAAALQQPVLAPLRAGASRLPPGATVFAWGHRRFAAPGVPVFATSWDLNGAIKAVTGDPSLSAFPLGMRRRLLCRPRVVGPFPTLDKRERRTPYALAFLLRVSDGRIEPIATRGRCLALRREMVRTG